MDPTSPPKKKCRRKWRMTPARRAANRVRAWKHGRRARVVTLQEGRMAQLRKIHPDLPEIIAAAVAAIGGDLSEMQQLGAQALAQTEVLRRQSVRMIAKDGVTVTDQVLNRDGELVGTKIRAHPLLETTQQLQEVLGFTAEQMRLTNKSRREYDRDHAIDEMMRKRRDLLSGLKSRMLPPAKDPVAQDAVDGAPITRDPSEK